MAYVTPLYGGSDAQIDYRLGLTQHGCDSDASLAYHTDARERALMWIGAGLDAFGVAGMTAGAELIEAQFEAARRLIRGQHPDTGEQLVAAKVAVPAEAKVPLGVLVAAVNEAAQARWVDPAALFEGAVGRAWETAARAVGRRGRRAVARVDEAVALAEAAGLDPAQVWGAGRVGEARAALWEPRVVRDAAGEPVLGRDGQPKFESVERRVRVGIAGYDIGITLPKSLSVLLAFAPDDLVARVEGVYAQAATRTFSWAEGRTSYVKRGHHGDGHSARQERSSGMAGWVMTHRAARPVGELPIGDPHWHVHITVANMAQAPDGTWLTIAAGGRELMRHAPAIDKLTQAQIRAELHAEFGITFARAERTGLWEVEHIPAGALELFSKRAGQVTAVLAQLGYEPGGVSPKESRVLTRACRSGKGETTGAADVTLREYWRAQALAAGYDPAAWMPAVLANYRAGAGAATERANETMQARHGITLDAVVARLTNPEVGLTAHTRRFSHLDAITATAEALPHGATVEEVERITELVLSHPSFVELPARGGLLGGPGEHTQLSGSHEMAGGQLFTTGDVPAAEQTILDMVAASHADQRGVLVEPDTLAMAINVTETAQGYTLSVEQRGVLETILAGGRAIESLEGPAGTGKTTVMRAARVAWEAQGLVVAGAATAAVAAQGLATESGIESRTCEQWLTRIEAGRGLAGVDVLVLDEANLTDDRDRAALYTAAGRAGVGQIVEIHDPKQHRSPGCGSMAGYIHAVLDGPRLSENRRQRSEDERAALAAYRDGRFHEALGIYDRLGQVVATRTSEQGVAQMVATWMRVAEGAPDPYTRTAGLVMVTATNEASRRLNEAVQAVRAAEGQLGDRGATYLAPGGREVSFHVGDHILIRKNDRHNEVTSGAPVLNGYRGVVSRIGPEGVSVSWRQADDPEGRVLRTSTCNPGFIAEGGLDLGYAMTTHKAEGLTVGGVWDRPDGTRNDGTVLVWAPGMDAPGQYVGLSRDRGQTLLFGSLQDVEGEREHLHYGVPRNQTELTERVIAGLAEHATATAISADDRPVLVDLHQAPSLDEHRAHHDRHAHHDRQDDQHPTPQTGPPEAEQEPASEQREAPDVEQHEAPDVEQDDKHPTPRTGPSEAGQEPASEQREAPATETGEREDPAEQEATARQDTPGTDHPAREDTTETPVAGQEPVGGQHEAPDAELDAGAEPAPTAEAAPTAGTAEREDPAERDDIAHPDREDAPETAEAGVEAPVEYWLDEQWRELHAELRSAQLGGDDATLRAAFERRRAYETEHLDPDGHDQAGRETWEQYAGRVLVTDEHRQRYAQLGEQWFQAWRDKDPVNGTAAEAAQAAFRAEIGPERAERLHRETIDRLEQRAEQRRVEQETRQQWLARPHSTLTDNQLTRAIGEAEAKRAAHLAAAENTRATIAETEPAVAAGQGPHATGIDAYLAQVRHTAELTEVAHEAATRRESAQQTANMSAAQASGKRSEATRAPWYRPGLRERLLDEAAQLETRSQQAAVEAAEQQRQLGELREAGAGPHSGWDLDRIREQVRRAEGSYERERDQAHRADLTQLVGRRKQLTRLGGDADTDAARAEALAGEQRHRVEMPAGQAATENLLRLDWVNEQRRIAEERAAQQQQEYEERRRRDHHYGQVAGHSQDLDHGYGLER